MEFTWELGVLILAGFAAGFINTLAGGGSLLTLPMLIFIGLPPNVANGTNRIAIVVQTAVGTAGFKSKGVSTYPFNLYVGLSALMGSIIGAQIAVDISGDLFNRILAIIMIVVVMIIVFKPKMNVLELAERLTGKHLWMAIGVFFFFGIYGGFINAGLGFLMLLFFHYVNRMSLVRSNSAKVAVVLIYTIGAVVVFAVNDKIDYTLGLILALGNATGAWVGSRWSVKKGDGVIKIFLVVMVVAMAIKLWFF